MYICVKIKVLGDTLLLGCWEHATSLLQSWRRGGEREKKRRKTRREKDCLKPSGWRVKLESEIMWVGRAVVSPQLGRKKKICRQLPWRKISKIPKRQHFSAKTQDRKERTDWLWMAFSCNNKRNSCLQQILGLCGKTGWEATREVLPPVEEKMVWLSRTKTENEQCWTY